MKYSLWSCIYSEFPAKTYLQIISLMAIRIFCSVVRGANNTLYVLFEFNRLSEFIANLTDHSLVVFSS